MKPAPSEDRDLLSLLRDGEDGALDRLIARWERPLFAFAWRYTCHAADSQDLVAETFLRLYQQRDRLRPDTNLSAWLFTTLSNRCHNWHRWKGRHPTVSIDEPSQGGTTLGDELATDGLTPLAALENNEEIDAVRGAIDQLPHDQKATLLQHYFNQLPRREIAAITGCSERGVETRLYRARRHLRKALQPDFETAPAG